VSEALDARAEVLKLARLLRRDPASLQYLEQLPSNDVRLLREQATEMLFSADGHALSRLVAASKLLPIGLIAIIAERVLGGIITARIAGMLDPSRAVDVAAKLPVAFLADVATELDPRRASDVIARIPTSQIGEVTGELVRRAEHVTIGRFVGRLGDEAIHAALAEMDGRKLLNVAFVLEEKATLDHLLGPVPQQQLAEMIDAAAGTELWPELLDLANWLREPLRQTYLALVAARTRAQPIPG
jgi:hypothetical protein